MINKVEYILKHNLFIQKIYKVVMSNFFRFCSLFIKIDENLVLLSSLTGKPYYDSPRAIFDKMITNSKYKNLKFVWAFVDPSSVSIDNCEKVNINSFKYFFTAIRAKYWITNVNIERGLSFQTKGQIHLNTNHGYPLNFIGNAVSNRNDYDLRKVNYFCYEGELCKDILINSFRLNPKSMLPSGYPRNDELWFVTDEIVNQKKIELGLPLDKKIILYTPTWRDSKDMGKSYELKPPINLNKWEKLLGNEYIFLLRTHHFTTKLLNVQFNDFVRDFTTHPRINDLFVVADVLISDYSSCQTDFCILERPMICFAYDYDVYKEYRGLNFDFDEIMPSGVIRTEDNVISYIRNMNYDEECIKTKKFKNKYIEYGGNAAEMCINAMFGDLK